MSEAGLLRGSDGAVLIGRVHAANRSAAVSGLGAAFILGFFFAILAIFLLTGNMQYYYRPPLSPPAFGLVCLGLLLFVLAIWRLRFLYLRSDRVEVTDQSVSRLVWGITRWSVPLEQISFARLGTKVVTRYDGRRFRKEYKDVLVVSWRDDRPDKEYMLPADFSVLESAMPVEERATGKSEPLLVILEGAGVKVAMQPRKQFDADWASSVVYFIILLVGLFLVWEKSEVTPNDHILLTRNGESQAIAAPFTWHPLTLTNVKPHPEGGAVAATLHHGAMRVTPGGIQPLAGYGELLDVFVSPDGKRLWGISDEGRLIEVVSQQGASWWREFWFDGMHIESWSVTDDLWLAASSDKLMMISGGVGAGRIVLGPGYYYIKGVAQSGGAIYVLLEMDTYYTPPQSMAEGRALFVDSIQGLDPAIPPRGKNFEAFANGAKERSRESLVIRLTRSGAELVKAGNLSERGGLVADRHGAVMAIEKSSGALLELTSGKRIGEGFYSVKETGGRLFVQRDNGSCRWLQVRRTTDGDYRIEEADAPPERSYYRFGDWVMYCRAPYAGPAMDRDGDTYEIVAGREFWKQLPWSR